MSRIRILAGVAIASVFALASVTASAATVTQCGPNICYEYDDAQGTLYGNPTLSGDALVFTPGAFRAESTGTQGVDTEAANFVFTNIYSVGGAEIADIQVSEFLDYDIINGDSVRADLRLTATNLSGAIPEFDSTLATFTSTGDSGGQQSTTLTGSFSPAGLFDDTANSIQLSLQNTLTAETDALGENAWIQKKATITITALVPIPAAVWLFGSGLVGLVAWGRRR